MSLQNDSALLPMPSPSDPSLSAPATRTREKQHASYPSRDIEQSAQQPRAHTACEARIVDVEPYSPADDAGFEPGCKILAVDGHPVRDLIEWRWLSDGDQITLTYIDLDGEQGDVVLEREMGESWGFSFDGLIFDDVHQCRNACTFCFMHQLPKGLRPSLTLRDDDFRLSFLVGTFVTLTNMTPEDEKRIVQQRITPLHVSLQASDPTVRRSLIGRHAAHGLEVFDRLLEQGIQAHVQIVLVPDQNDKEQLVNTLNWAYARPNILDVGIVPLGYTRFQTRFDHSFNEPHEALRVLEDVASFQKRALLERGHAWVYPADEFYSNAYGEALLDHLPPTEFYGDFQLFEDGIGIIRSTVDDWLSAQAAGVVDACAQALRKARMRVVLAIGCAQRDFLSRLINESALAGLLTPLYVENDFFGGNVNVTGLLVGHDVAAAIARHRAHDAEGVSSKDVTGVRGLTAESHAAAHAAHDAVGCSHDAADALGETARFTTLYAVQSVVFNDDGLMLDDMRLEDVEKAAGTSVAVVSCSPLEYLDQLTKRALEHAGSL